MTQVIEVDVTVENVKWKKKKFYYKGDFTYEQTSPPVTPTTDYVQSNGKIKLKGVEDDVKVILNWKTPQVEIDGSYYAAAFLQPRNQSVRLAQGENVKPIASAPKTGDQISVPDGVPPGVLEIVDLNNDGEDYTYNLLVHVDVDGGHLLIDDPIIENRGGPGGPPPPPPPPPPHLRKKV